MNDTKLKDAMKRLHARKDKSYAGAWKRRGERVSILPNIARKVDRLEAFVDHGMELEGETVFDTIVDLFVYAEKYRLFLAESDVADNSFLPRDAPRPYSDWNTNFDHLVDRTDFKGGVSLELSVAIRNTCELFEEIWAGVDAGASISARQLWASKLSGLTTQLVGLIIERDSQAVAEFVLQETTFR